jgi:hypothetical protein
VSDPSPTPVSTVKRGLMRGLEPGRSGDFDRTGGLPRRLDAERTEESNGAVME